MITGLVIAFSCGWRLALIILPFMPFIAFGGYLSQKIRRGGQLSDSKALEHAGKVK